MKVSSLNDDNYDSSIIFTISGFKSLDFSEERNENDVDYRTVQYNPNKTLPLDHQRSRLPIFNVNKLSPSIVFAYLEF